MKNLILTFTVSKCATVNTNDSIILYQ